ncbi:MAG: acetolactate synthase small subunit [Pyrinomonas sp.]|mgnify:CR=1 FL=1|uniref:acetolactate synthase small subunit n=1 Tax=Pyrinomonas sp. TaxID=2080306 RepID=UPI00332B9582
MRRTLSILVADQPGELSRIVGLFSARGFNIEALTVAQTLDPRWSRVTVATHGDERTIEQIVKQCARLVRVQQVRPVSEQTHVEREMALISVDAPPGAHRQELLLLARSFDAKIIEITGARATLEITGARGEVATFIELLRPLGVRDVVRSGCVAIERLIASAEGEMAEEAWRSSGLDC